MSCPQIPLSPRRQFEPLVRRAGETGRPAWKLVCFGTHNRLWKHYFVCVCVCAHVRVWGEGMPVREGTVEGAGVHLGFGLVYLVLKWNHFHPGP